MNLVLTFDYELFGDGSGDVFKQMIEPTNQILEICAEHSIKTTIFFEAIEYLRLKEEWEFGNKMGYQKNPTEAIENQLKEAALGGHDIQLHIHPQWVNAMYENEQWEVDFSNWRLADFKTDTAYDIEDLLIDGKETIETLIREVKPGYQCIALRAGGYNAVPSAEITKAMNKIGLSLDSSTFPGGYGETQFSSFDYRKLPINKDYWYSDLGDLTKVSFNKSGIMEIPIFALEQPYWRRYLTGEKIKLLLFNSIGAISSESRAKLNEASFRQKLELLLKKDSFTWDFCLFNKSLHKKYFSYIENNLMKNRNVFVLIGHPKSLTQKKMFQGFIDVAKTRSYQYQFKTLKEVYQLLK